MRGMREDYESWRRIAFSDMIRWESSKAEEEMKALRTNSKDSFTSQQLILRSLTLVLLKNHSPLLHLSAHEGFLEYAVRRKAVLG